MKSKFLGLFLLMACPVLAGGHFFFGFGGGGYYPRGYYNGGYGYYRPPVVTYVPPPVAYGYAPTYNYGPDYYDNGYYSDPYYAGSLGYDYYRRPFAGAFWVAPRYYGGRHYRGFWRRR
ncbi:MAG: hypothetical protein M3Z09_16900 [Acidobacteriota bacterium]|nr:hypothetical protein [Acidobacteriota bacterium]